MAHRDKVDFADRRGDAARQDRITFEPQPPCGNRFGAAAARISNSGEFEGVRAYRRGDPLKLVVWKKAAKSLATGTDDLVSRDAQQAQRHELWLDLAHAALPRASLRLAGRALACLACPRRASLLFGVEHDDTDATVALGAAARREHRRRGQRALAAGG